MLNFVITLKNLRWQMTFILKISKKLIFQQQHQLLAPHLTDLKEDTGKTTISCNKSSAVAEMGNRRHNRHGPKRGGLLCQCPFPPRMGGSCAVSPSNTVWPELRSTSTPSGIFIPSPFGHNRHWLKMGGAVHAPFGGGGELGLHLTQCGLGRGLPPYQVASWSSHPFCQWFSLVVTSVMPFLDVIHAPSFNKLVSLIVP